MMGLLFVESLPGQKLFRCNLCGVDIASADDVMSSNFNGRSGPACVVARVVNIIFSQNEPQPLLTGLYDIKDAHCSSCQQLIGWRFPTWSRCWHVGGIGTMSGRSSLHQDRSWTVYTAKALNSGLVMHIGGVRDEA